LHLDNAKEFRSQALARGTAQYGIELHYRPPATPHWGGHIERLIGTTMGALRLLPGATGSNVGDRPEDPEAAAVMTLDELEIWLIHQIAGIYHNTCHRSLRCTPITAWNEAVAKLSAPHRLPEDRDAFFRDFLPFRLRTVQRQGVSLFGITYSDGILSTLLAKPRQKFVVRYDPRDMSRVYLRDPDGVYWPIPYSDRRQPPVTLAEIRAASRRVRAAGEEYATQRQLFASMAEQRVVVEDATAKTKLVRRELERSERALRGAAKAAKTRVGLEPVPSDETVGEPIRPFEVEEWS
jgi:putative transposase